MGQKRAVVFAISGDADSPKSEIKPIKGPALMLRGDASTLAWHSVSQEFSARTGVLGVRNVSVTKAKASDLPKSLLVNSDFKNWSDGLPNNWSDEIGAKNGAAEPTSKVIKTDDPGLSLQGAASTMAWHSVSQSLSVAAGKAYRLEFQARSENVQRQGRQYNNCYVGVMFFDANGQRVGQSIKDLSRSLAWGKHKIDFKTPPGADKTSVIIFLSKTGTLTIKNVILSGNTSR